LIANRLKKKGTGKSKLILHVTLNEVKGLKIFDIIRFFPPLHIIYVRGQNDINVIFDLPSVFSSKLRKLQVNTGLPLHGCKYYYL
jgi:hypothetical protein